MTGEDLKQFLEEKYERYNRPDFIPPDPISIPHRYSLKEDIEVAGLLAALIAWGKRELIIRAAGRLMEMMGNSPYDFVMEANEDRVAGLGDFVYRTFQGPDCVAVVKGLRRIYSDLGGPEALMTLAPGARDTGTAILRLRRAMLESEAFPARTQKHFADPSRGSAAKRINMFLRWMVRKDRRGVDFGIWTGLRPDQLICPLDLHTGNVGRKLGLISRKQNDWKCALALTEKLREFDPDDPVKYDFALFGLGIYEGF